MNKTLRWFVALVLASLISYTLFASLALYIGNTNYDYPTNRPSISINFVPIHKDKREQTHPAVKNIAPAHPHHNDIREKQKHLSKPTRVHSKPAPISIAKHTSAARKNRATVGLHPIFRVEPIYPLFAIARNIEGWVEIEFLIAANGAVVNPKVIASEPSAVFEQTAVMAVSQWRYLPGKKSKSSVHIKFELRDD